MFSPPVESEAVISGDRHGLRFYQREAVDAIERELKKVRGTLLVFATGLGKTRTCASLVADWPGRVLWLAGRDFLLEDARERLQGMTGEYVSLEKADVYSDSSRIVVASVQTLHAKRLLRFAKDAFSLIVYDEFHHAVSPSSRAIFLHFDSAKIVGPTATPNRLDGIGLHNVVQSEAARRDIDWAISEGFFCKPIPIARFIDSIDLSGVKTTAGDLNLGGLETEIAKNAAAIALVGLEEVKDLPSLWYTPGVASAKAVADTLNQIQPGFAVAVDAETPGHLRREIRAKFNSGAIRRIVNCGIFLEGYDVPNCLAIVNARPTKSQALYQQIAGRGGRPEGWIGQLETTAERLAAIAASGKPNFLLVDITGTAGRHNLINPAHALAGKHVSDAIKDRADKLLKKNDKRLSLDEAFGEAKRELEEEEDVNRRRVAEAAAAALVKSRRKAFDPFKRLGLTVGPLETGQEPKWTAEPPSQNDLAWLRKNRLPAKNATKGTVATLRKQARQWMRQGRASFGQRGILSRIKAPVDVSFVQASALITLAYQNGRGRFPLPISQGQIDSVLKFEREPGSDDE